MYGLLAEATVVVHLGWIVFLVLGAIPGRRIPWVRWTHLAGLAFGGLLTAFGWICPLTYLEVWLRDRAGRGVGYQGSFIGHYAERLVYLELPRNAVLTATALILVGSLTVYLRVWLAQRRGTR